MAKLIKYCIDTNSLIDFNRNQPFDIFRQLWVEIEKLIENERLIAPYLIKKEIERGNDELVNWARLNKKMFFDIDKEQMDILRKIMVDFQDMIDPTELYEDADPWVVALAKQQNTEKVDCYVVTEEKLKNSPPNITYVCKHYGLRCLKGLDFIRNEKWQF